jgi:hypothetical protein
MSITRFSSAFLALTVLCGAGFATEYIVPAGKDVGRFFAELPKDATSISFSAASTYSSNGDIVLPDVELLVIDGKGCTLQLGPASNGFTRHIADQKEAMRKVSCRYTIQEFGAIEGGRKGIDLQATLGSVVRDCRLTSQTEVGIDLRFCLMARIQNVLVTLPAGHGIRVRQGDWPGASASNSQSNSTVLDQCRVFASKSTIDAFTILNSGGVRLVDCISEGGPVDHDLFLSATTDGDEARPAGNTVVKSFTLDNFHVEHKARKGSIYVNMPPKASVDLTNVYWNGPQDAPVILYTMGQLNLRNIGWWNPEFRIHTRISAPRINVDQCHSALNTGKKDAATDIRAGSFHLVDALPDNKRLKLDYVRVSKPSM